MTSFPTCLLDRFLVLGIVAKDPTGPARKARSEEYGARRYLGGRALAAAPVQPEVPGAPLNLARCPQPGQRWRWHVAVEDRKGRACARASCAEPWRSVGGCSRSGKSAPRRHGEHEGCTEKELCPPCLRGERQNAA